MHAKPMLFVILSAVLAGCGGGGGGAAAAPAPTITDADVTDAMLFIVSGTEVGPRYDCSGGVGLDSETMVRPYPEANGATAESTALSGGVLTITETYATEEYQFVFSATAGSPGVLTGTFRRTPAAGSPVTIPALAYIIKTAVPGRSTPHPAWPVIWEDGDGYRYAMAAPAAAFGSVTSTRPGFVSGVWLQTGGCMYVHAIINDGVPKAYDFGGVLTDATALQASGMSTFGVPGSPAVNASATMHVVPGTTL